MGHTRLQTSLAGARSAYSQCVEFILITIGMVLFGVGILVLVGHFNERRDVELIDWRPTRSSELEAQNEIDDTRQMLEAQNEMRRRRGVEEIDEERLRAEIEEEELEKLRRRPEDF